jgi:hypothetical protein
MNGKEMLERGLRRGMALWRIEDELDWQENQSRCRAVHDARRRREPVAKNGKTGMRLHSCRKRD